MGRKFFRVGKRRSIGSPGGESQTPWDGLQLCDGFSNAPASDPAFFRAIQKACKSG